MRGGYGGKDVTWGWRAQDGEANDKVHSYVRIQFHCNATYEARQAHPQAAFIKELSFRSAKSDAAQKFVQVRPCVPIATSCESNMFRTPHRHAEHMALCTHAVSPHAASEKNLHHRCTTDAHMFSSTGAASCCWLGDGPFGLCWCSKQAAAAAFTSSLLW